MARKKLARTNEKQAEQVLSEQPHQEPPSAPPSRLPSAAMEDAEAKFSKLKSLNEMLLKETTEKRREVSSLIESKLTLETELTRSSSEIEALRCELARIKDGELGIEVEKDVVSAFVESQVAGELDGLKREVESLELRNEKMREQNEKLVREKDEVQRRIQDLEKEVQGAIRERKETDKVKSEEIRSLKKLLDGMNGEIEKTRLELSTANHEREAVEKQYNVQVEEAVRLKRKLSMVEAEEKKKDQEVRALKLEYDEVVKVKNGMEMTIESMNGDMKSMETRFTESNVQIQKVQNNLERIKQQKVVVEKEKNEMRFQIEDMVKEAAELNSVISSLRKDEENQRAKFLELENAYAEALKKQNELNLELTSLFEENKKKDSVTQKLAEDKSEALKRFFELEKELESVKEVKEALWLEKCEIEQAKAWMSSDNVKLQEELTMLRDKLSAVEESYTNQSRENKQLSIEIAQYRSDFERVNLEKDKVQKILDEEKLNGEKISVKLTDASKKLDDATKKLDSLKAANGDLVMEKKELETSVKKLSSEKSAQEKKFLEAQKEIVVLQETVKSKGDSLEQALLMLKKAAQQFTKAIEEDGVTQPQFKERDLNGDFDPYMGQLEAIRAAFANRELKVEEMKQQVDWLQDSVIEARKKKSFWTLVSSATTILAAVVSFAYASKLR